MTKKAVVIGAGAAGISAAIHLAKLGLEVTVIESKNFCGGRAYSFVDKTTGDIIDNGQHLLVGAYKHFLNIINTLGNAKYLSKQEKLKVNFIDENGDKFTLSQKLFPGKFGLLTGLLSINNLSIKSRRQIVSLLFKLQFNLTEFDNTSVYDYLIKEGQGIDIIKKFWEPLVYATLNNSIHSSSAKLLIEVLKRAFFSARDASCLIFPNSGLSDLFSGFPEWLERNNGKLILGNGVSNFILENNKMIAVVLKDNSVINGDVFISALAPDSLNKILPDNSNFNYLRNFFNKIDYSTIISIYLWLDTNLNNIDFAGLIGTNTQWVFNKRKICHINHEIADKYPGLLALTISNANKYEQMDNEHIVNLCYDEIKKLLPELSNSKILSYRIFKDKKATILITPEIENLRPGQITPVNNFFISGDWTATGLPATLESAAYSGYLSSENAKNYLATI